MNDTIETAECGVRSAEQFRAILAEVRDFIEANRPRFRGPVHGWADHWEKSLAFHATRGNLALVWSRGSDASSLESCRVGAVSTPGSVGAAATLVGVAIAWRLFEHEIWAAEHNRRSVFEWRGN